MCRLTHIPTVSNRQKLDLILKDTMSFRLARRWGCFTIGESVGCIHPRPTINCFEHRDDVAVQTTGISGAIQKRYNNFQDAIQVYRCNYNQSKLRAIPVPGGIFWPVNHLSSAVSSSSSDAMWDELEDLSEQFNQVTFE
jgi:hypothetical protein